LAVRDHLARVAVSEVLVGVGDEVDHGVVEEDADHGPDDDRQHGDDKALAELRKMFDQCHAIQLVVGAVAVRGTRGAQAHFVGVTSPHSHRRSFQAVVAASSATGPHVRTAAMTAGTAATTTLLAGTMQARPVV
jgi:hypothetical protein